MASHCNQCGHSSLLSEKGRIRHRLVFVRAVVDMFQSQLKSLQGGEVTYICVQKAAGPMASADGDISSLQMDETSSLRGTKTLRRSAMKWGATEAEMSA